MPTKARKKRRVTKKRKTKVGKIKLVKILKNGNMRTVTGRKVTWSQIASNARFIHSK